MNVVALLQCVFAATSFAEATVVKKNAKFAKELGASTRSARLKDLTPTVEKAASATASAVAPRIQTAALYCFRYGEFRSLGECWKQLCFYQLFMLFPVSIRSTRLNNYSSPLAELPLARQNFR